MNKPLMTDDSTPSRNAVVVAPTAQVRTTQATLIAVIAAGFVCGGYLVSIENKVTSQAKATEQIQANVDLLMREVFYGDPRMSGNTAPVGGNSKTQPRPTAGSAAP